MALPYTPPKNTEELDKRKELASVLKQFARNEIKVNPEDMVKSGATMGVSRGQLSNLYQQYRKDFLNNPPEGLAANTPPATTPPANTQPISTPLAGTPDQPETKGLDRLTAMQGSPMGSTSSLGQRRSLESDTGRALRMARRLERQGFGKAAENIALRAGESGLAEPALKTEAYRAKEAEMSAMAEAQAKESDIEKRKNLDFLKTMREQGKKELLSGGLAPATASFFGSLFKQ
jgi:hypothetical protein